MRNPVSKGGEGYVPVEGTFFLFLLFLIAILLEHDMKKQLFDFINSSVGGQKDNL